MQNVCPIRPQNEWNDNQTNADKKSRLPQCKQRGRAKERSYRRCTTGGMKGDGVRDSETPDRSENDRPKKNRRQCTSAVGAQRARQNDAS